MTRPKLKEKNYPQSKALSTAELTILSSKVINKLKEDEKLINSLQNQLDDMAMMIEAIRRIKDITPEVLGAKIRELKIELLEKDAKENEGKVLKAVEEGKLVVNDKVDDNTLVGISAVKSDGSPKYPSLSYIDFSQFKPEIQAIMRDKVVGDVVTDPSNGDSITVKSIYAEVINAETSQ
jgi:hypothetical protein